MAEMVWWQQQRYINWLYLNGVNNDNCSSQYCRMERNKLLIITFSQYFHFILTVFSVKVLLHLDLLCDNSRYPFIYLSFTARWNNAGWLGLRNRRILFEKRFVFMIYAYVLERKDKRATSEECVFTCIGCHRYCHSSVGMFSNNIMHSTQQLRRNFSVGRSMVSRDQRMARSRTRVRTHSYINIFSIFVLFL